MAPFIAANGQKPGWKRGSPPAKIRVPARRIQKRADLDGDSSDDEAGPTRQSRRATVARTRDTISTRDDEDLPTPVPNLDLTNDALNDGSGSDSDSGPDSPASPTSPTNSPAASAPPPAAQPSVTLTPIRPPGPSPTPQPELPPPPPPAAPPSPTTTPPLVLPSAAPPPAPPAVAPGRPDFSNQPIPRPNLPVNDQVPDQPVAAPLEPPPSPPITVTAPPEIRTITAAPPAGTVTVSPSTSDFPSTFPLSITTRAPALPVFDPTAPRRELEPPNTFSPTTTSPDAVYATASSSSTSFVTGTALPVEDNESNSSRGRMDPNTEHALIAVGSIGSFIFASFIIWIVWRTARRTRKKRRERQSQSPDLSQDLQPPPGNPGLGRRIAGKIPLLRNLVKPRGWRNLDDGTSEPPPYEKGGRGSLRLDTDVYGGATKSQPGSASYSLPQTSANGTPITISPTTTMLQRNDTILAQQGTYQSGNGTLDSIMAKYGNGGDMGSTLQSAASGLYYTESEIARQQPNGYARRQASRASEISSLSSGFGDGDIIVPGLQPPPPTSHPMRSTQNVVGRYSWVSKSGSNRETVYTETSEDLPPRFRTVNSWVNQQTGRVKRAEGRGVDESDVPPVPGLPAALGQNVMPPEQQFNMMMPDGEEPRRPDGLEYQLR